MTKNVNDILDQISNLEEELRRALSVKPMSAPPSEASGRRPAAHLSVPQPTGTGRRSLFKWTRFRNVLAAPIIYALIVPMVLLDITVTLYQAVCFPLFGIQKSRRSDFISIGRHRLTFLNAIEKIHCVYCEYINGLLAFVSDIASKTEQYFCPIKYANKVITAHARYDSFQEYGDNINFHESLKAYRRALRDNTPGPAPRAHFDDRINDR
jgi:hypothetical protein